MKRYDSTMKISQIKRNMREELMKDIQNFLEQNKEKYPFYGQSKANAISVVVGEYTDEENFPYETSCVIQITAKPFYDKITEKGNEIECYDARTAAENFVNGVEE